MMMKYKCADGPSRAAAGSLPADMSTQLLQKKLGRAHLANRAPPAMLLDEVTDDISSRRCGGGLRAHHSLGPNLELGPGATTRRRARGIDAWVPEEPATEEDLSAAGSERRNAQHLSSPCQHAERRKSETRFSRAQYRSFK